VKPLRLAVLLLVCVGAGMAAGYKLAVVKEQGRLERNKTLVRLSHEKVWSEHDPAAALKVAREIYTPNFMVHDWTGDSPPSLEEFFRGVADNRADFPDWTEKVEAIIAEGDYVATRFISTGTQGRDLAAITHHVPATPNKHRSERIVEMEVFRVANGKLAEQWDLPDIWNGNMQLGMYDPDHWIESICGGAKK
jgi:predicted SnoaL-like aldol condensation-catalyzing enzyme